MVDLDSIGSALCAMSLTEHRERPMDERDLMCGLELKAMGRQETGAFLRMHQTKHYDELDNKYRKVEWLRQYLDIGESTTQVVPAIFFEEEDDEMIVELELTWTRLENYKFEIQAKFVRSKDLDEFESFFDTSFSENFFLRVLIINPNTGTQTECCPFSKTSTLSLMFVDDMFINGYFSQAIGCAFVSFELRPKLFDCCSANKASSDYVSLVCCNQRMHLTCLASEAELREFYQQTIDMTGGTGHETFSPAEAYQYFREKDPIILMCAHECRGCVASDWLSNFANPYTQRFDRLHVTTKRDEVKKEVLDGQATSSMSGSHVVVVHPILWEGVTLLEKTSRPLAHGEKQSLRLDPVLQLLLAKIGYRDTSMHFPDGKNAVYLAIAVRASQHYYYVGKAKNGIRDRWFGGANKPATSSHMGKATNSRPEIPNKTPNRIQAVDALLSRIGTKHLWVVGLLWLGCISEMNEWETSLIQAVRKSEYGPRCLNMRN